MRLATMTDYALRLLMYVAQQPERLCTIAEIAHAYGVSEAHLMKITHQLGRQGWLETMRGKGGGYVLTRPPEQYTVGEILRLTEGSLAPVACLDGDCKGCSRSDECPTLDVWKNLDKLINDYLDGVTLDQLVTHNEGYDYVI